MRRVLLAGVLCALASLALRAQMTTIPLWAYGYITDPANPAADVMLMEPEYHGDTNGDGSGVLAYRYYGRDLVATLEAIGFEVHYTRADVPHEGVMNTELFYCRKVR